MPLGVDDDPGGEPQGKGLNMFRVGACLKGVGGGTMVSKVNYKK